MKKHEITKRDALGRIAAIDLIGKRFGRLTVISFSHRKGNAFWNVVCDCGEEFKANGGSLTTGHTKSCGCLMRELTSKRNRKHNLTGTKIYKLWATMLGRCNNPKDQHYKLYGGRGIKVCDDWLKFENFYKDMGDKPEGMSLDRIDNNGDYCKGNCRWATQKEQMNNTRNNVYVTINGEIKTKAQWMAYFGVTRGRLDKTLNKAIRG